MSPAPLAPVPEDEDRPFWSVIVPLYERRTYLKQCLASVLDQDPGAAEMEIVVIDDASPSDLRGFVEGFGCGRVAYVRNPANLGLYPSTNAAIRSSRGRWLHILHDDDWVMPGFYSVMKKGAEAAPRSVGAAFCMYANLYERDGKTWSPQPFRSGAGVMPPDFLATLASANPLNLPAVVFRREAFERVGLFREDLPYTADWEWYVRSALQFEWHYQPEALARYRVHAANQTLDLMKSGEALTNVTRTLDIIAQYLPRDVAMRTMPPAREFHARNFLAGAFNCLQSGDPQAARRHLREALLISEGAPGIAEFARVLQHPRAAELRSDVRAALLSRLT